MIYAIGCDLSRYNERFNPDLATAPIDFAIQKATEGLTYVDLQYDEIWEGVAKVGIRGAYCYQRSGLSWLAQADHFLETAARHDYHIYALDLEEVNNTYSDSFFSDTKRIIDHWRANSNKKVVLYTNGSTYDQLYYALVRLYGYSKAVEWLNGVPLWLASPAPAGGPYLPKTRQAWDIHQFSWSGLPGRWGTGGTRVDENVYNGDVNAMRAWLGLSDTVPNPPQPPTGETMQGKVLTGLYIRPTTGTTGAPIGQLQINDIVEADTKVNGWWHLTRITRNGVNVPLPAANCYSFEGTNQGYIQTLIVPPAPAAVYPVSAEVTMSDGSKWTGSFTRA